jgi:hypothetical protein
MLSNKYCQLFYVDGNPERKLGFINSQVIYMKVAYVTL